MKKLILSLILASGMACSLQAQNHQNAHSKQSHQREKLSPDERARREADKAEKQLGLSAEQKAKWEAAVLGRVAANMPLKEKLSGSTTPEERQEIRRQLKDNRDKFETSVDAFLNADQKTKFAELKKEHREAHKNHMRKNKSGAIPERKSTE